MIGMYGPSFFTGSLIQPFGVLNVIFAGIALLFICIVSALAGTGLLNFWLALFLLGVGWNFVYMSSGLLLQQSGWHAVNYGSIPFLTLAAIT